MSLLKRAHSILKETEVEVEVVNLPTDDTKNAELPVINEALEKDAVESPGNNASDAGNNGPEEEEMVS
ncbi:hypothetical protein OPV22_013408 [Ensete ventricosum]|uniref:Uncharacterized protein n=1 Tax=Ensete ventricosum TaxID=4639 RepID=A0AAV8R5E0_ENSVE|nr:hypothetical protein OPV22_013408 [Ensete ventricosum]